MVSKINIGLIGAGRMGKIHARNIRAFMPEVIIKTIADLEVDRLRSWAADLGVCNITKDYRDIVADPELDAVLICSSADSHAAIIIDAARAGKHIFCEKPVDLSIEKVKTVLDVVTKAKVILQVGFNRRFDHNHRSVKAAVEEGRIGEPHLVMITSRDPEPPPPEFSKGCGGLFLDMSIHDFDMLRYLSSSEVVEIYAAGEALADPVICAEGDVDTAVITLKLGSGAIGVINNSRKAAYGYDQRVEVFGSAGSVANFNDVPSTTVISCAEGIYSEKPLYFFRERYRQSFIDEIKSFIEAIFNNREPLVDGNDGLQAMLIALASRKSMLENRPVKLSEVN